MTAPHPSAFLAGNHTISVIEMKDLYLVWLIALKNLHNFEWSIGKCEIIKRNFPCSIFNA